LRSGPTARPGRGGLLLERIPSLAAKVAEARASGWRKYPSLYLGDVAGDPAQVETLLLAVRRLTDEPSSVA